MAQLYRVSRHLATLCKYIEISVYSSRKGRALVTLYDTPIASKGRGLLVTLSDTPIGNKEQVLVTLCDTLIGNKEQVLVTLYDTPNIVIRKKYW